VITLIAFDAYASKWDGMDRYFLASSLANMQVFYFQCWASF
jgi:hypothetical protein